jgi:hypothetical protein
MKVEVREKEGSGKDKTKVNEKTKKAEREAFLLRSQPLL